MDKLHELQVAYEGRQYKLSARLRLGSSSLIVVFLHGWGGSKESFAKAFSSDTLKGYGICTIDLLGFGGSDKPEDFSYDLLDQANVVALAINSLKADKVYLVGHSMGGGIGLLAAPQINNLVMFISAEGNLAVNGRAGKEVRMAAAQTFRIFSSFTLPTIIALLSRHPKRHMRPWARWYRQASPTALYRSVQSLARWSDAGKLLPFFEALPHATYVYGAKGRRKRDVVPKLDSAVTYEIPKSGHALMSDDPTAFYETIARIIRES